MRLGARYMGDGRCRFAVWAPDVSQVELKLLSPRVESVPMRRDRLGYWRLTVEGLFPGACYRYLLDGERERPDPASRFQPEGVDGPSEVADPFFPWDDGNWRGRRLEELVIYELHVGTFTPEGSFDGVVSRIPYLKKLGVTALELMPVGQFPGERNWGYDGVYPFAPQNSYGGPKGLKRLVDACHRNGLMVILDVVYNHLGPEGNYLGDFGPYFTDRYRTPWGDAVNLDGPCSDEVRRYFIENALSWLRDYHIDGLRLDAVHHIYDFGARHFLKELADTVRREERRTGRTLAVIAESDLNNPRLVTSPERGGYGLDAQWCDDFHHALHALLTGERSGYYADFGDVSHLARALSDGYVYTGQHSRYRRRRHGAPPFLVSAFRFIVSAQNHDQVGNRAGGERLAALVPQDKLRLAAATVMLSPFIPLLFMGEEYGETSPFPYFVSHADPLLIEAVRRGRVEEFSGFGWEGEKIPDPQDEETFRRGVIDPERRHDPQHAEIFSFYHELIRLRRRVPALFNSSREETEVRELSESVIQVRRWCGGDQALWLASYSDGDSVVVPDPPPGEWQRALDSAAPEWGGAGEKAPERLRGGKLVAVTIPAWTFVLYRLKTDLHRGR